MSHTTTISLKMTNLDAIQAAASRLDASILGNRKVKFFSGSAQGFAIQLPGFIYPIVIDPKTGTLSMDHYGWKWGSKDVLNQFKQYYGVEVARSEAAKHGYSFKETVLPNGEIRCKLTIGNDYGVEGESQSGGYGVADNGGGI